jgi:hypothetical protein
MVLRDIVSNDGHIWLKSEWGPASQEWPALSFSKRTFSENLRGEFNRDRDAVLYVGTGSDLTRDPEHRRKLLSAMKIDPRQVVPTRDCIPPESWDRAQKESSRRWLWSLPALEMWDIVGFPLAREVAPRSYAQLGFVANRGNVVEAVQEEREAILRLELRPISFVVARKVSKTRTLLNLSDAVQREISRMVSGIVGRVSRSGTEGVRVNPIRTMSESNLHIMLGAKWDEQEGRCFLCQGPLRPGTENVLLQSSPDRLDSGNEAYDETNTHITHLGCNLAKNKVSLSDFEDWLMVVRGELDDVETDESALSEV